MVATYDFMMTRDQIISRALRICGAISDADTPTTDQVTNAALALNSMVKRWQNDHIYLWTLTDITKNTSAGTANISLSSDYVAGIEKAFIRDASNNDIPLEQKTYSYYLELSNKTPQGQPYYYAFDSKISPSVYLYPTPNAIYSLHLICVKLLADFDASSDNPDAASNWIDALVYGLADSLADEYILPAQERAWVNAKAKEYRTTAKGSDRGNSDSCTVVGAFD